MTRIGIIGAGQLGMMLGEAARKLDVSCVFLDPSAEPPAATVGEVRRAKFDDVAALRQLAADTDVLTYEFENVPVDALEALAGTGAIFPPPQALRHAQDRLVEKRLFESLGIPVAPYRPVDSRDDLRRAADALGLPIVLKTRRLGYDGKGQVVLHAAADLDAALADLGERDLIAERMIPFDREVSAIGVRSVSGDIAIYPLVENRHRNGILDYSSAPAGFPALAEAAEVCMRRVLERLDYVGTLTIEFFAVDGELLANEYAPRVHNSGHWTIEGARTSQFENHLRAILDLPLGDTTARGHAAMINLIGSIPDIRACLPPGVAWLHDYGKSARPGRKLGHVTLLLPDAAARDREAMRLREKLIP